MQLAALQRGREPGGVVGLHRGGERAIGGVGHARGIELPAGHRRAHGPLEHARGTAHRVVPVDVAVHLVLGEEERFEGRDALLVDTHGPMPCAIGHQAERGQQPIDVDGAVGDATLPRVPREVIDLVEIERAGNEPAQRRDVITLDDPRDLRDEAVAADATQEHAEFPFAEAPHAERFVGREAGLLERMREGIVSDVVEQRRQADREPLLLGDSREVAALFERGERAARQVIGAERVLEARVRRAGVDQEGVTELADVPQPLHRRSIHGSGSGWLEADVVPERVADDFELGHWSPVVSRRS